MLYPEGDEYGLWILVVLNSLFFVLFGLSFLKPKGARDWRAMGTFWAFIVALFTEMYGFPLTIYVLSGWLGSRFPQLTLTHGGGHLWNDLIGWTADPHLSPFHLASDVLIIGGTILVATAWRVLWEAQRQGRLATSGPYARIRHPQYAGLFLVLVGLLLQWPTIPTIVLFPVLVIAYWRLARAEEREVASTLASEWRAYAASTPRFIPRLSGVRIGAQSV